YMLFSSAFSIVFIVGLLFNIVALYIFTCSLKQRNETTTYMLNLVVCDTLFVLSLPFRISYFLNGSWSFGKTLCKISVSLFYMNMYGSIMFLTCISADRFLAIVYPFASRSLRTKRNAKIACCTVWLLVLSVSLSAGFQLETSSTRNNSSCFDKFSKDQWQSKLSSMVLVIETVGFLIPLLVNLFCSGMILRTLRKPDAIKNQGQLNKAKILRMIVVHLLVFCFCFVPYNVNLVFYTLVRTKIIDNCVVETVVKTIYPITLCIAVTNCCFDPVIYYFTSETIQNCIKRKIVLQELIMDLMNNTAAIQTPFNCTVNIRYRFTYFQISYSVIFICGVASNSMALWRVWLMPWTLTSTAVYMANLAVVDFLFLLSLPLRIYYYNNRSHSMTWAPGSVFCQLTFALKYISMYGGIFFLACIGLDRYIAVTRPVLRRPKQVHNAYVLSTTMWLMVLTLSFALPFMYSSASDSRHTCLLDPSLGHHQTFILAALGLVSAAFMLPALVLLFSYCRVLRVLGRMPHRGKSRHRRTLSLIYCVLGIFLLCFTPYHSNLLCYTLTHVGVVPSCGLAKFASALHPVMLSLASANCCLNPLVY
ncbi:lysophosphatidic acid receptor 6, partial [Silurus asotus]